MDDNVIGHVFISYGVADGMEIALRLHSDLETAGIDAWLDKYDIRDGFDWDAEIDLGLRAARAVVVVLTPGSILSLQVKSEWNDALNRFLPIIPLLTQDCIIPRALKMLNYIDFRHDYKQGFDLLKRHLDSLLVNHLTHLQVVLDAYIKAQETAQRPENFQYKIEQLRELIARWNADQSNSSVKQMVEQREKLTIQLHMEQERHINLARLRVNQQPLRIVGQHLIDIGFQFRNRQRQFQELMHYLANPQTRLVSVIGRGGIGKTGLVSRVLHNLEMGVGVTVTPPLEVDGIIYLTEQPGSVWRESF